MDKTHVKVTVKVEYVGNITFEDLANECEYGFFASKNSNADIVDSNMESQEATEIEAYGGLGILIFDLLIHHDDVNLEYVIDEMDYKITPSEDQNVTILNTEIIDMQVTDSR